MLRYNAEGTANWYISVNAPNEERAREIIKKNVMHAMADIDNVDITYIEEMDESDDEFYDYDEFNSWDIDELNSWGWFEWDY